MRSLSLALLAFGLAMDAFAVALSQGATGQARPAHALRIGAAFGLAQALMPLAGAALGLTLLSVVGPFDHWVALIVLTALGGRMIWQAFDGSDETAPLLTGWSLVAAAVATSVDALAAGVTLPTLGLPVLLSCVVIGLVTALLCVAGARLGGKVGGRLGRWADVIGGLVLIGIGVRMFVSHQFFGG